MPQKGTHGIPGINNVTGPKCEVGKTNEITTRKSVSQADSRAQKDDVCQDCRLCEANSPNAERRCSETRREAEEACPPSHTELSADAGKLTLG